MLVYPRLGSRFQGQMIRLLVWRVDYLGAHRLRLFWLHHAFGKVLRACQASWKFGNLRYT